jgi:hypothetical protein
MSYRGKDTSVANSRITQLCEIVFIASIIITLFILILIPYNYKDSAVFTVSIMTLFFNFMTALGSGVTLLRLSKKNNSVI